MDTSDKIYTKKNIVMKKLFFILVMFLTCVGAFGADVMKFQATQLAYKVQGSNGAWEEWSDWEDCDYLVVLNFDKDRIQIYTSSPIRLDIYKYGDTESQSDGGNITTLSCVDEDGDECEVRVRFQEDGQMQLYIDYATVMVVYNLSEK